MGAASLNATAAGLTASLTAGRDQLTLYGIVGDARAALEQLERGIRCREIARPGAEAGRLQIDKARVIARSLVRALEDFR